MVAAPFGLLPTARDHAALRNGDRQRVVVGHLVGPGRHRGREDPAVDRLQRPHDRATEHRRILVVHAGRILARLDVVGRKTRHWLGKAEPHRKGALHGRWKVGRHLDRQGRDCHPLARLGPTTRPLVVGGPHLHFIDCARFQLIQRQGEPRPLVLTVDEALRALFPVPHVVVGDWRGPCSQAHSNVPSDCRPPHPGSSASPEYQVVPAGPSL